MVDPYSAYTPSYGAPAGAFNVSDPLGRRGDLAPDDTTTREGRYRAAAFKAAIERGMDVQSAMKQAHAETASAMSGGQLPDAQSYGMNRGAAMVAQRQPTVLTNPRAAAGPMMTSDVAMSPEERDYAMAGLMAQQAPKAPMTATIGGKSYTMEQSAPRFKLGEQQAQDWQNKYKSYALEKERLAAQEKADKLAMREQDRMDRELATKEKLATARVNADLASGRTQQDLGSLQVQQLREQLAAAQRQREGTQLPGERADKTMATLTAMIAAETDPRRRRELQAQLGSMQGVPSAGQPTYTQQMEDVSNVLRNDFSLRAEMASIKDDVLRAGDLPWGTDVADALKSIFTFGTAAPSGANQGKVNAILARLDSAAQAAAARSGADPQAIKQMLASELMSMYSQMASGVAEQFRTALR